MSGSGSKRCLACVSNCFSGRVWGQYLHWYYCRLQCLLVANNVRLWRLLLHIVTDTPIIHPAFRSVSAFVLPLVMEIQITRISMFEGSVTLTSPIIACPTQVNLGCLWYLTPLKQRFHLTKEGAIIFQMSALKFYSGNTGMRPRE